MKRSVLRLRSRNCNEDAPHQEAADAVDPVAPPPQHGFSFLAREQPAYSRERIAEARPASARAISRRSGTPLRSAPVPSIA